MSTEPRRRGRPQLVGDADIFDSALRMFATHGYEGMSLRALNGELGLSHGTINQRFGSKEQLYLAAIDHGFGGLLRDVAEIVEAQPLPHDPLEELLVRLRAFLLASARRPHLNRVISNEGVGPSPVLDRIFERYIVPGMRATRRLVDQLVADGVLEPTSDREILFLLANGAGSAYSLAALSAKFDPSEGSLDPAGHADRMATLIVNGMRRWPGNRLGGRTSVV